MSRPNPVLDHPLFAAFFQASPDMIFIHGPDGRIVDVNPQVERTLGYRREEIVDQSPALMMGEGFTPEMAFERLARARAGEPQDFAWVARAKCGEEIPVEVRLRPLQLEPPGYVLALVRDQRLQQGHRQAHERRRDILRRIADAERSSLDPDRILHNVIVAIRDMFQASRAFLGTPLDPEADYWTVPVQSTDPAFPGVPPGERRPYGPRGRYLARVILNAEGAMALYPTPEDVEWGSEEFSVRSALVVPVRPRLGPPWLLGLHQCTHPRVWTETERALLTELAERVAPLLDALTEQRQRQAQESRLYQFQIVLAEVARTDPGEARDLHHALHPYTEAGAQALGVDRVSVWLLERDQGILRCLDLYQDGRHRHGERLRVDSYPVYFAALETGRGIAASDARQDERTRDFLRSYLLPNDIGAMLDAPIRVGGELVGVLCCEHCGGPRQWRPSEQAFAASLADQVALVVDYWCRREAEQALAEQIRLNQAILENTPTGYLLVDAQGRILEANPAYGAMVDEAPQALVGRQLESLDASLDQHGFERLLQRLLQHGSLRLETRHRRRDGSWVDLDASLTLLRQGQAPMVAVFAQDISERKAQAQRLEREVAQRTAELQAANEELRAFSYTVSHDLRAPLRAIDGFSAALEEEYGHRLDAQGRDYLGRIRRGVRRMDALIGDLLTLSRISRSEVRRQRVDLSALAETVAQEVAEREPERTVHWDIAPGLVDAVDPSLMRVALENLFSNAFKFTRPVAAPQIRFGAEETDEGRIYFVADNGVGFDPAQADRLFQPFQRLHGDEPFEGTGIGLATVARIVARHGGRIWAESAGRGATFYFTLGKGEITLERAR